MADLTVYNVGESVQFVAASAGGDTFDNDGAVHLLVANEAGTGNKAMTVESVRDCDAQHGATAGALIDFTVTIPEAGTYFSDAFSVYFFTAAGGKATVRFDDVTGVTIAAFRVRQAR